MFFNNDELIALEFTEAGEYEFSFKQKRLKQMETLTKPKTTTVRKEHVEFVTKDGRTKVAATSNRFYALRYGNTTCELRERTNSESKRKIRSIIIC